MSNKMKKVVNLNNFNHGLLFKKSELEKQLNNKTYRRYPSYDGKMYCPFGLVERVGLEPTTSAVSEQHSNQAKLSLCGEKCKIRTCEPSLVNCLANNRFQPLTQLFK